jgi:hypothetical protein
MTRKTRNGQGCARERRMAGTCPDPGQV